jgi:hypothetical protein
MKLKERLRNLSVVKREPHYSLCTCPFGTPILVTPDRELLQAQLPVLLLSRFEVPVLSIFTLGITGASVCIVYRQ